MQVTIKTSETTMKLQTAWVPGDRDFGFYYHSVSQSDYLNGKLPGKTETQIGLRPN